MGDVSGSVVLLGHGPCIGDPNNGALEMADANWPATGTGTALLFETTRTSLLIECYWFAGYAYYGASSTFNLTPGPYGGRFADDSNPLPRQDSIAAYGRLGFNTDGLRPCPGEGGVDGADGSGIGDGDGPIGGDDQGDDAGDDGWGSGCEGMSDPSNRLSIYLWSGAMDFDPNEAAALPLNEISFADTALRATLVEVGALRIQKIYPGTTLADTLGYDIKGQRIRLPDLSGFYYLTFPNPDSACAAVGPLGRLSSVRLVEVEPGGSPHVSTDPHDTYFDQWNWITHDAQWPLRNNGQRAPVGHDWACAHAQSGYDVGAEDAWSFTYGDSNVVVGSADLGILGGTLEQPSQRHNDLRVIPLSYSDRQRIQVHPNVDWCDAHGTKMAGLTAARTNNYQGVAGVCGNCSLLDIEVAKCLEQQCDDHSTACEDIDSTWTTKIYNATTLNLGNKHLRAILMSYAYTGDQFTTHVVDNLWRTYQQGIALVAPSNDRGDYDHGNHVSPADVPFVLGVGGSTWDGRFWQPSTSCWDGTGGTMIGPSEQPLVQNRGSSVSVCGPASGSMVTTSPFPDTCETGPPPVIDLYTWTHGECSAAAALTAGAAGLLQSVYKTLAGADTLNVDDLTGLLRATAQPFRVDPSTDPNRPCSSCPREYYGSGIVSVGNAAQLLRSMVQHTVTVVERVASKNSGYPWTFAAVDSAYVHGTKWVQYRASAQIEADYRGDDPLLSNLPGYIAWPRRSHAASFGAYGRYFDDRVALAQDGVHDCRMSVINQTNGAATISGYTYASVDQNNVRHFLISEDAMRMPFVAVYRVVDVPQRGPGNSRTSGIEFDNLANPASGTIRCGFTAWSDADARVVVLDVGGRVVRTLLEGKVRCGWHSVLWDGRDSAGEKAPSGVYWISAGSGSGHASRRLVLVR